MKASIVAGLGVDDVFGRIDAAGARWFLTNAGLGYRADRRSRRPQDAIRLQPFGLTTVTGESDGCSSQFAGREATAAGLYYYRARHYSPATGRFLSEDPLGFVDGPNLYAYVLNDPISSIDPFGLQNDSVSRSLQEAMRRGNSAEIENSLDAAKDVLSKELREAAQAALQRLRSKATDVIAKKSKGSVRAEFPEQWLTRTVEEIFEAARKGDSAATTAKKLLTDLRFNK